MRIKRALAAVESTLPRQRQPTRAATGILTVTGSTLSRNTAAGIGGGGADLYIFAFALPGGIGSGSASFGTTTFSNNRRLELEGESWLSLSPLLSPPANFTSNSAGNRGGGIFVGGASLTLERHDRVYHFFR